MQVLSFSNVCLQAPCPPNPTTPLGTLANAAAAKTYGAEVSVDAHVTNELSLQAGISVLDATFSDYDNAVWNVPAPGGVGLVQTPIMSAEGKQMPRAPKATLSLIATYTKDLPAGEISLSANGYASERIYFDVGNVFYQPSYATLGLSASFSPSALPGLTASVWGNNLTNEAVILSTFLNAFGALASYAPPRTYGATLSYKF
jgi:iron complex outermembrane receptor protein